MKNVQQTTETPLALNRVVSGSAGLSVEDAMFLFGWEKGKRYGKFTQIRIQAENAWLDGKDADANPFQKGTVEHGEWHGQWYQCNKHC